MNNQKRASDVGQKMVQSPSDTLNVQAQSPTQSQNFRTHEEANSPLLKDAFKELILMKRDLDTGGSYNDSKGETE